MKILPVDKIREADEYTIHNEPIASIDLMERAATNLYNKIKVGLATGQRIHIFAGIGNNGGDGLVLARLLHDDGFEIKTWIVHYSDQFSPDFQANLERLKQNSSISIIKSESEIPAKRLHSQTDRPTEPIRCRYNCRGYTLRPICRQSGRFKKTLHHQSRLHL